MSDIQLQISGKQIDTIPIINLLRQGENNADTILMQLPPKYGDIALDGLTYIMYGDSKGGKSGTRATQVLEKEVNGEGVLLRWKIADDFTAVAGELRLLLKGFLPDGNPIIKWVGGTINVYCDPAGGLYPPPVSEVEQALKEMYLVLEEVKQNAQSAATSEKNAQTSADDARVSANNAQASATKAEQIAQSIQGEAQKIEQATQAGIAAIDGAGKEAIANVQLAGEGEVSKITAAGSAEVQKVATEGAKQVQAATEQANLAKQSADGAASKVQEVAESVTAGKQEIATAKDATLSAVQGEGGKQVQAVNAAGTAQVQAVNDASKAQITAIGSEGTKQSKAVSDVGAAQVQAVGAEGQKQVATVQAEGRKQAEEIKAIESLLPAPTAQDKGKVPMVNPEGNGYELGEVVVDAYTKAESDKRFAPMAVAIKPTASGELITLTDSADFALQGLKIYGKSTQDGEPTPENPIPIVSVGEGGSVTLTISNTAEQQQIFPIPTPNGLPGIPVKSGGNYTDSKGQQWVCDEIDFDQNLLVHNIYFKHYNSSDLRYIPGKAYNIYTYIEGEVDIINGDVMGFCSAAKFLPSMASNNTFRPVVAGFRARFDSIQSADDIPRVFPNGIDCLFLRKTSQKVPIADPELVTKLNALHTYYPTTNLFVSDNAGVEVQYLADTKLYIDSKLQSLVAQYHANQAAMLSLMPLETQAEMIQNDTDNILSQEGI